MKENVFSLGERKRDQCPPERSSVQGLQRISNNETYQPVPLRSAAQPRGPAPRRSQGSARPGRDPPRLRARRYASPGPKGGRTLARPWRSAAAPAALQLRSPRRDGHSPARPHMSLPAARPCAAPLNVTAPQRCAPPRPRDWRWAAGRAGQLVAADPPLGAARPSRSSTATSGRAVRQLRTPQAGPARPRFAPPFPCDWPPPRPRPFQYGGAQQRGELRGLR